MKKEFFLRITKLVFGTLVLVSCGQATKVSPQISWENGHPVAGQIKCDICHLSERPATTKSSVRTTASGRSYTVRFHAMVPSGFSEDPGVYNDCGSCHTAADGWAKGNFGLAGQAHLTDSQGAKVSRCLDCHDYPADFWRNEHTYAQTNGYDCSKCHLSQGVEGGTQIGGFGIQ